MSLARSQRAPDPEHGAWLVFRLGPHRLCAAARDVEGIIEPPSLTRLPGMPAGVIGVFAFRDEFALAVSLARKLGVRADSDPASGSYVVARVARKVAGFQVDEAQEVLEPAGATWHALPSMLGDELFDGFAVRDGELILRTTFEALLNARSGIDLTAAHARAEAMAPAPEPKPARAPALAPAPARTPSPRMETKPAAAPAAKPPLPPKPVPIRPKAAVKPALAPARPAKRAMPPRAARLVPPPPEPVGIGDTLEREIEGVDAPAPEVAKAPAAAPTPPPITEKSSAPAYVAPASAQPAPAAAPVLAARFERATPSAKAREPEERQSKAGVYVSLAIAAAALIALGVWLWPESVPVPKSAPAPTEAKPEPRIEARSEPLPEPSPAAAPSALPASVRVLVDSPRLSVTVERAPAKAPSPAAPDTYTHVVVRGDTLWAIARRYVGDPYRYPELAKLSRIRNPDLIHPGDIVRIRRK